MTGDRAPRRTGPAARDEGFSVVEMIVVLIVIGIVAALTFSLFVGIEQQSSNTQATSNGTQQAKIAGDAFVQYLRTAFQIAGAPPFCAATPPPCSATPPTVLNPNPDTSNAQPQQVGVIAEIGSTIVTQNNQPTNQPTLTPVYAAYTAGGGGLPTGTGTLKVTDGYGSTTKTLSTFYVLGPGGATEPFFTYYVYTLPPYTAPPNTSNLQGSLQALPAGFSSGCLPYIVAIGIHISFFAGPEAVPTRGYAADIATTVSTTVYLHNSVDYGSATVAVQSCPQLA